MLFYISNKRLRKDTSKVEKYIIRQYTDKQQIDVILVGNATYKSW